MEERASRAKQSMPSSIQLLRLRVTRDIESEGERKEETFRGILSEWERKINTKSAAARVALSLFGMTAGSADAAINNRAFLALPLTL